MKDLAGISSDKFIFLDESSAKTNMTRLYGRCLKGKRVIDHSPYGHWKTITMLSAIRLSGVIEKASIIIDGAMNRPTFESYTQECLAPSLRPGDIVIMDNLSSHKSQLIRESIEDMGGRLIYLPPYSPDLNPIEQMWSKVKTYIRQQGVRSLVSLQYSIAEALQTVTPENIAGWFKGCNYL